MKYTTKQLATVVIDLVESGKASVQEVTDGLVRLLAAQHDLKRLHDLERAIEHVWKQRYGVATLTIETAHPLTASLRKKIEQTTKGAEVREVVNPDLIGGARLTIDDRVIDGTITGTLDQLRTTLYGN